MLTKARMQSRVSGEDGVALLAVLGSMVVTTLFLLSSLAYALQSTEPSRDDQDSKTALAAAQAGIDDYLSRLNVNDTYYTNGGVDPANPAFGAGMSIPGTGGKAGSFAYKLLSTTQETANTGIIRLQVTGRSQEVTRTLVVQLSPDGFLKYIYFTDLESQDPVLYRDDRAAKRNGQTSATVTYTTGNLSKSVYTWTAAPSKVDEICSTYYYAGRRTPQYTAGDYIEKATHYHNNGTIFSVDSYVLQASPSDVISFDCVEIRFTDGDKIYGPLHSNDALQITGAPLFDDKITESSWGPTGTPPGDPAKLWWGSGTPTGNKPIYEPVKLIPSNNSELRTNADPLATPPGTGCLYTGETRIRFEGTKMRVLSPGTTTSVPACYNTGSRNTEQLLNIPPVIYVQEASTCGSTRVGYPMTGEVVDGSLDPENNCRRGTAFVSGVVSGRVTIGSSNDIVVRGNLTYQNGLNGSDAIGLIPQNTVWVYNPIDSAGKRLLTTSTTAVCNIDAAILSVAHSFSVQNLYNTSAGPVSTCPGSKLVVRGAIAQKHRGPVSGLDSSGNLLTGYLKDYTYDKRLFNAPPPFFLRPTSSPWLVSKVSD